MISRVRQRVNTMPWIDLVMISRSFDNKGIAYEYLIILVASNCTRVVGSISLCQYEAAFMLHEASNILTSQLILLGVTDNVSGYSAPLVRSDELLNLGRFVGHYCTSQHEF